MDTFLTGKTAIVTGAASGIGLGIAQCFALEGVRVILADINIDAAQAVVEESDALKFNGSRAIATDITSNTSVQKLVDVVLRDYGRIDILVNAAGISGEIQDNFFEFSLEEVIENARSVFEANYFGGMRMFRLVGEHMRERRSGVILNIASIVAHNRGGMQLKPPYNASKAGVINTTLWSAVQLAQHNVRVNSISPGIIWTKLWEKLGMQLRKKYPEKYGNMTPRQIFDLWVEERIPLGREQTPEDIGWAAVFLASDRAKNITGADLLVDGGVIAR